MITCPLCRHELKLTAGEWKCVHCTFVLSAVTAKPYLKDSLPPDKGKDINHIDWSGSDEEPRINCWMDVDTGPDGTERISYMLIDGAFTRDHIFIDYVEGGHFYRYNWIPEDQIWIEDEMSIMDRVCTGIHEIHERYRMKYLGWNYERAHASACVIERTVRDIALEENTILPTCDGVGRLFAMEGSGQDCEALAWELMTESSDKIPKGKR